MKPEEQEWESKKATRRGKSSAEIASASPAAVLTCGCRPHDMLLDDLFRRPEHRRQVGKEQESH
jgi:hypothetical protein